MPKIVPPLSDIAVRNSKAREKPYKLADGGGLYLEVMPTGSKLWRMKFRQANGKESRLAFGIYPETTLVQARNKRDEARKLKSNGSDPGQAKKEKDRIAGEVATQTFEKLARDWHSNKLASWHPTTAKDTLRRLEIDIFPQIGAMPIASITHQHMIVALRKIEARGAQEIAHRVKSNERKDFQLRQPARHQKRESSSGPDRCAQTCTTRTLRRDHSRSTSGIPSRNEQE
jgi:hypothetical protein